MFGTMSSGPEGKTNDVGPPPTVINSDSGVGEEGLIPDNQSSQDIERLVRIEWFQCLKKYCTYVCQLTGINSISSP